MIIIGIIIIAVSILFEISLPPIGEPVYVEKSYKKTTRYWGTKDERDRASNNATAGTFTYSIILGSIVLIISGVQKLRNEKKSSLVKTNNSFPKSVIQIEAVREVADILDKVRSLKAPSIDQVRVQERKDIIDRDIKCPNCGVSVVVLPPSPVYCKSCSLRFYVNRDGIIESG